MSTTTEVPAEALEMAWYVACSYGELIPAEAERLLSVSGLTPHMALSRAQVETIVRRVAPILIAAGRAQAAADIRDALNKVSDQLAALPYIDRGGVPYVEREYTFDAVNKVARDVFGKDFYRIMRGEAPARIAEGSGDREAPDA